MPYLCALIFAILFAGVAMTVNEGLWNNLISLAMLLICGPLAIAAGYPLGMFLQEKIQSSPLPEQAWYFVFGGVWLVFFFSIMLLRLFADRVASRVRMKFVPPLERAAGPLVGLLVAAVFASFLTFTLYTIPIRAGEWKFGDAASWEQTTMRSGSGPFYSILRAMAGEEIAQASFSN